MQKALFYTVMVDETTDSSNKEQAVLVLRWVDGDFLKMFMKALLFCTVYHL